MEGYVISPTIIYLIGISDKFIIAGFIVMIAFMVISIGNLCSERYDLLKKSIIGMMVSLLVITIMPDKDTCYMMLLSKTITYENLNSGKEVVKDSIDYLAKKIIEIKGE